MRQRPQLLSSRFSLAFCGAQLWTAEPVLQPLPPTEHDRSRQLRHPQAGSQQLAIQSEVKERANKRTAHA